MAEGTKTLKVMTEQDVLAVVLKALEVVAKRHEQVGRHEINRTDLLAAVAGMKVAGSDAGVQALL